ncbi:MAG: ABC transporter permease, partial [Gammaproteobacteria bacterium]|nr:ABC transporter permease [Gammaproteobacteria bacterium]NIS06824.1 ABC transporter permease [Gammaproteobacteria bacterium]NIX05886.1 ABC transporter permease [Gammaproteobacteria bacterium]
GQAERPEIEIRGGVQDFVDTVKNALTGAWRDVIDLTAFLGEVVAAFARLFKEPWRFRTTSFFHHLDYAGLRALPIIALICFL